MGARDGPPALPATRLLLLGRRTTATSTGKWTVSTHARRCWLARTLTRSGRPMFVSRLQPHHAPRLDASLQHYRPSRRHPLLVQGPRSSLVLGKISDHTKTATQYVVRFLDNPRPVKLKPCPSRYKRLLELNATRGPFKLVKVDPFSREFCATSTSPVESNVPIPSRIIDVPGIHGWFSTGIGSYR